MKTITSKPDNVENLFKKENYCIISPLRSNSEIFNKRDFMIEFFKDENNNTIVFIQKRQNNDQQKYEQ